MPYFDNGSTRTSGSRAYPSCFSIAALSITDQTPYLRGLVLVDRVLAERYPTAIDRQIEETADRPAIEIRGPAIGNDANSIPCPAPPVAVAQTIPERRHDLRSRTATSRSPGRRAKRLRRRRDRARGPISIPRRNSRRSGRRNESELSLIRMSAVALPERPHLPNECRHSYDLLEATPYFTSGVH